MLQLIRSKADFWMTGLPWNVDLARSVAAWFVREVAESWLLSRNLILSYHIMVYSKQWDFSVIEM